MKRFFCLLLIILGVFFSFSCNQKVDLTMYISQTRTGIYQGEVENLKITVYVEKREEPFLCDGFVGTLKNLLICKVESDSGSLDDLSIEFNLSGKKYGGKFVFNPINGKYTSEIEIESLISSPNLKAVIFSGENKVEINLNSKVIGGTISYKKALNSVCAYDKGVVKNLFESTKINSEIHLRLLQDEKRSYYYVGFLNANGGMAYLVDGLSAKVLAKKKINNMAI